MRRKWYLRKRERDWIVAFRQPTNERIFRR